MHPSSNKEKRKNNRLIYEINSLLNKVSILMGNLRSGLYHFYSVIFRQAWSLKL